MRRRKNTLFILIFLNILALFMWTSKDNISIVITSDTSDRKQNPDIYLRQSSVHEIKPVFIFLHVPKTGGSLVKVVLERWCVATNKYCYEVGWLQPLNTFQKLLSLNASELNKIDVLYGHIPFGIHRTLKLRRPIKYFTMIRDPVKQALSAFDYERFRLHYLSGAFALQATVHQLNKTYRLKSTSSNHVTTEIQLNHHRNAVISCLTKKHTLFENAKGCFAGLGGTNGWSQVHNRSAQDLQSMNTSSLITFAHQVVSYAWNTNCTAPLSPVLKMSFRQFLTSKYELNSLSKRTQPAWDFGNNPTTAMFCCHHLWFVNTSKTVSDEQLRKCPRILNEETLRCALDNMKQMDLILITEQMKLSLRLLERFLNWTIPSELKHLRMNEAVNVTPSAPPITSAELAFSEKLAKLDRMIYQTALLKFWSDAHSSNIVLDAYTNVSEKS